MAKRKSRSGSRDVTRRGDIPRTFETRTAEFNYTRQESMVPMRDGVKLFTMIMIPEGATGKMPIVLTRTPYNAKSRAAGTPSPDIAMVLPAADEDLVRDGYIRVYQDVRGRFGSKGKYTMTMPVRGPFNEGGVDQVTDAWDTVEWLVENVEGNNGRVGITGTSYDGLLTLMALIDPHPALKAAVPVNSMVDSWLGDDFYRHGAFRTVMFQYVYRQTSTKDASHSVPWGYRDHYQAILEAGSLGELGRRYGADRLPAWKRLLEHPAYDDYWRDQALQEHLARAPRRVPVLSVHSLFDAEDLYGAVLSHEAMAANDPRGARTHLVIGPWSHAQTWSDGSALGSLKWGGGHLPALPPGDAQALLRPPPQAEEAGRAAGAGDRLRDREQPLAAVPELAAGEGDRVPTALPAAGGGALLQAPQGGGEPHRVRLGPGQAGALPGAADRPALRRGGHLVPLAGRRPAAVLRPHRRPRLRQRDPAGAPHPVRRSLGHSLRLDHGDRRRLGGQAHRPLPRRGPGRP